MYIQATDTGEADLRRRTRLRRLVAVAAADVVTLVIWVSAVPFGDMTLSVDQGGGGTTAVGAPAVVVMTTVAGLAGWGLLALLERNNDRAWKTWTTIAVTFLAISLVGPLTSGIGWPTKLVLTSMHLTAGLVLIPSFARTSRCLPART